MKFTTTVLLVVLVAALGAFVVHYESRKPGTNETLRAKAKPFSFKASEADALLISGKNMEVKIARQDGVWRITQPFKDRANADLIARMVTAINALEWVETVRRADLKTSDWKRAGLNDASLEIALSGGGKDIARLKLGSPGAIENSLFISTQDAKGNQLIHLARTPLGALTSKTAEDWRDTRVLRLPAAAVTRFVFSAGDGVLEFSRAADGQWEITKPLQARASQDRVNAVLNALLNLEGTPEKPGATPPPTTGTIPEMKVALEMKGASKPVTLTLQSAEKPEDPPIVSVSDRPGRFTVPAKVTSFWKLQPNHLRDQHLVHIDPQKADSLRIRSLAYPEIVLTREAETWMLARHGSTDPANQERVRKLLEALNTATVADFAADAPKSLEPFGLQTPFLEVEWSEGEQRDQIHFGKSKEQGIFAKLASTPFVYRIDPQLLNAIPPDSLKWRSLAAVHLGIFSVRRIVVSVGVAPPTTLLYDPSLAAWKGEIAGRDVTSAIDRAKADALLQKLVDLSASEWTTERTAAYAALKAPTMTIQILTVDPLKPESAPEPLTLTFAPLVPNADTAIYHGRVNQDPDTFLIGRDLYRQLATPVLKE